MSAVRAHKTKTGRNAPIKSLVLFTDRMVTNCPMKFGLIINEFPRNVNPRGNF